MKTETKVIGGILLAIGAYFLYTKVIAPKPAEVKAGTSNAIGCPEGWRRCATDGLCHSGECPPQKIGR